jgi:hypothetical protein
MAGVIGNRGNRRSGPVKGIRNRKTQLPWRQDSVVMERIAIGAKIWAERHSDGDALRLINQHMASKFTAEPAIGRSTMYEDRKHIRELWAERREDAVEEHLASLDHTISEAWKAFHTTRGSNLNRSAYLSTIGNLVEKKAKLDGTLVARSQVSGEANLSRTPQVNLLVQVRDALADLPPERRAIVADRLDRIETDGPAA